MCHPIDYCRATPSSDSTLPAKLVGLSGAAQNFNMPDCGVVGDAEHAFRARGFVERFSMFNMLDCGVVGDAEHAFRARGFVGRCSKFNMLDCSVVGDAEHAFQARGFVVRCSKFNMLGLKRCTYIGLHATTCTGKLGYP